MKSPRIDEQRRKQVAKTIHNLRNRRGLSQEKLAAAIGVRRPTIHNWETARYAPSLENCKALAQFFKVDISYFATAANTQMPLIPALLQFADVLGEVSYPVLHGGEKNNGDDAT